MAKFVGLFFVVEGTHEYFNTTEIFTYTVHTCTYNSYDHFTVSQVAAAKASILWLVGEYCGLVPKIAPDVLRKAAKEFVNEVLVGIIATKECLRTETSCNFCCLMSQQHAQ